MTPIQPVQAIASEKLEKDLVLDIVNSFLSALRSGDSSELDHTPKGSLYGKLRKNLADDPGYAQLIRKRYKDTQMNIRKITALSQNEWIVDVAVEYIGGHREDIFFALTRAPSGEWAIDTQIQKP